MERILQMIMRRAIGRLVNKGVDAGIDRATRGRGGNSKAPTGKEYHYWPFQ